MHCIICNILCFIIFYIQPCFGSFIIIRPNLCPKRHICKMMIRTSTCINISTISRNVRRLIYLYSFYNILNFIYLLSRTSTFLSYVV